MKQSRPIVREIREIFGRFWETELQVNFLYLTVVGAYIAILLNNAVSYYSSSSNGDDYRWAIILAAGAFSSGVSVYLDIQSTAEILSADEHRLKELGKIAGVSRKTKMPGKFRQIQITFFTILSIVMLGASIYRYLEALKLLLHTAP